MSSQFSYADCFPFDNIRDEQRRAIEFALDAFLNQKKRFVILEMGTGCGKSATGLTIAKYLKKHDQSSGYILTTQKILQDQYDNDFGPSGRNCLVSLKSSRNYTCSFYGDMSCGDSRRMLMNNSLAGTAFWQNCKTGCHYIVDKGKFINSTLSVTNFSFFLSETSYAKQLQPRGLLVIDECHNTPTELSNFIEIAFSERFAIEALKCKLPAKCNTPQQVMIWLNKKYTPALERAVKRLEILIQKKISTGISVAELTKQHTALDMHMCKVHRFQAAYDPEKWIMNESTVVVRNTSYKKFEFKPIDVSQYAEEYLFKFGDRVLMMSATVIDKDVFCSTIGVDPKDVAFLSIPSPFPVENRPVHFIPVGKMSMRHIDETLPALVDAVKIILDEHANDKGIIHCVNFRIARHLAESINSPRLLTHDSYNRAEVLERHMTSKDPTVLVSPSMVEGVDLYDDSSRFQVLCKLPFPYMGDKMVEKRMKSDPRWYPYQTAKAIIQAFGRSVRNENDHAVSYILDEDWRYFFKMNSKLFPADFVRSLVAH